MNRVIKILMRRDGCTEEEARNQIMECREALLSSDCYDVDEIIEDMLGLEPDYLEDILCML